MHFLRREWRLEILILFAVADIFIWYAVSAESRPGKLTVAFFDVGQGDAIYIKSPTGNEIMIDGGPPRAVMSELREVMPFYDRSIDTLLVTNPDADHFSGFIDMLGSYKINRIIEPGTKSDTERYAVFQKEISEKNIEKIIALRGMILHLGGGAELRILFPDRDASEMDRNEGSIVAELVYGDTEIMLTGDAPNSTLNYVLSLEGAKIIDTDILKAGHHGSRTSASEPFAKTATPDYAIISAGKDNRYGHPHKETTDLFQNLKIPVLSTFQNGTIVFTSDGTTLEMRTEN